MQFICHCKTSVVSNACPDRLLLACFVSHVKPYEDFEPLNADCAIKKMLTHSLTHSLETTLCNMLIVFDMPIIFVLAHWGCFSKRTVLTVRVKMFDSFIYRLTHEVL